MNIFEAIECARDGHVVRHPEGLPGSSLVLRDGNVVLLQENVHRGSVTHLERLHEVLAEEQLVSGRWEIGTSTEMLEKTLSQLVHNAEVADFESRIHHMQEADARERLEETPGTPYGTVLRDIDHHLAHAAEDPALLLLLDKWHTHHAKALLGLRAEKIEGVSRIKRRARA